MRIHHVQLMIPRGHDEAARRFYRDLLGLTPIEKPRDMPSPEGLWFALADGQLHLGVDDAPPAPTRAHVALLVDDLDALVATLAANAVPLTPSNAVDGLRRVHARDPFGNRLELMGR